MIDHNSALAHREDEDVRNALEDLFRDQGIELRLGTRVRAVERRSGRGVELHFGGGAGEIMGLPYTALRDAD